MPLDPSTPLDPGDYYWVSLPHRQGSEQSGRHPCVEMSRRSVNVQRTVVIVPMSSNTARANSYNILIPAGEIIRDIGCTSNIVDSVARCEHVRVVDRQYFDTKIGKLSQTAVLAVQLGLSYLFDLP